MASVISRPAKPIVIVSDFDGALTKKDSNEVLIERIRKPISSMEEAWMRWREKNIEAMRESGLLYHALSSGWHIRPNSRKLSKVSFHKMHSNVSPLPLVSVPPALSANLSKRYGRKDITSQQFFSAFLPTDMQIYSVSSDIKDWGDLNRKCLSMLIGGKMDQFMFHAILNMVIEEFLNRADIVSAANNILEKHIRPGITGLFAAAKELGAQVVFCSYSYLDLLQNVIERVSPRFSKSKNVSYVCNRIVFQSNLYNSKIARVERVGNKWIALDYALSSMGVLKHGGKYFGIAYDDGIYNVPDMMARFDSPILLLSKEKQGKGEEARLLEKYPSLKILAENGVSGIDKLRSMILSSLSE